MMEYSYSPELHPPRKTADFDLSRPGTKVMLKVLVKTHQKQTEAFVPPAGITCKREEIAGVPCFVVQPEAGTEHSMLYCHGGAFYLPTQVTSLNLACVYAGECALRVVIPEYSLTPDSPAPRALEECRAVQRAVQPELTYGESAGAAIAALLEKSRGQMLIYPVTDDRHYPSRDAYPQAVWSAASNRSMWDAYLRDVPESERSQYIPMQARAINTSPAYVETQEFDILKDEGRAYAQRLREAGVAVESCQVAGSYHGFDGELDSPLVRRVLAQRTAWLRARIEKE